MNLRRRKFTRAYLENGGNASKAAVQAGYSPLNPKQQGLKLLKDKDIRAVIEAEMERQGLTIPALVGKMREGLDATSVRQFNEKGTIIQAPPLTDFPTRKTYLDTAFRLRGALTPVADEPLVGDPVNIAVIVIQERERRGLPA